MCGWAISECLVKDQHTDISQTVCRNSSGKGSTYLFVTNPVLSPLYYYIVFPSVQFWAAVHQLLQREAAAAVHWAGAQTGAGGVPTGGYRVGTGKTNISIIIFMFMKMDSVLFDLSVLIVLIVFSINCFLLFKDRLLQQQDYLWPDGSEADGSDCSTGRSLLPCGHRHWQGRWNL